MAIFSFQLIPIQTQRSELIHTHARIQKKSAKRVGGWGGQRFLKQIMNGILQRAVRTSFEK